MQTKDRALQKVGLRNVVAHKLRLALTVVAVVLGTAFIAGSFMFTKTLSNSFDQAVATTYDGVDVVVSAGQGQPGVSGTTRTVIMSDPKVDKVNVQSSTPVVMGNSKGEAFDFRGSANLSPWYTERDTVREPEKLVEGSNPTGSDEVLLNEKVARALDINVGDSIIMVDPQDRHDVTVVGIYEMAMDTGSVAGLRMDESAYLDEFTDGNYVSQVLLKAADGVSPDELMEHVSSVYSDVTADTGDNLAKETSQSIKTALSFVNYFLVAFGLVALLVGTFLIANTFSMIVAQRTREFALLRALGASRGQITRSVVLEAAIIGVIGSLVGIVVGVGLVAVIKAVLGARGLDLPGGGLGLSPTAVIFPLVLGTVVTVLSAWMPARRAGAVRPVEAMRTTETSSATSLHTRTIVGAAVAVAGLFALIIGVALTAGTGVRASLVGLGAVLVIVGYFLASPALTLPVVPALGRLLGKPFGQAGKLAATNSERNPRRSATTAFALTLGVALVTSIGMLGATMKDSVSDLIEREVAADFHLSGPTNGSFPLPAETVDTVKEVDGVGSVVEFYMGPVQVDGRSGIGFGMALTQVAEGDLVAATGAKTIEGSLDLDSRGFIADADFAAANGWSVGDEVELSSAVSTRKADVELVGTYEPGNSVLGPMVVSKTSAKDVIPQTALQLLSIGVLADGYVTHDTLRENLEDAVKDYLVVKVSDADDVAGESAQLVDQMLNVLYGLLALAVIIAVLGIVNTLTLNVIERRREIGMLRAVGAQRSHIRTMITLEAVQLAIFGAISGMILGLVLGWAFLKVLAGNGLATISVPYGQLVIMLLGSGVVGVLAALWPARRAAATPALDAISEE